MAEGQEANAHSAAFPAPPPFFKYFTLENLAKLKEIQRESWFAEQSREGFQDAPEELLYLVPPTPPEQGRYHSFGGDYNTADTLPTLEEQGITRLYSLRPSSPSANESVGTQSEWTLDRAIELRKMAKSLLLNFMELIGVLAIAPEQYVTKIEDVRDIFINAHHLLNEYRPHQARETLILMMEEQLDRSRAETAGIKQMKENVESLLKNLCSSFDGLDSDKIQPGQAADKMKDKCKEIWDALEENLGP